MMAETGSILICGCGNMGGAMLAGWLARVSVPPRLTASLAIRSASRNRKLSASPPLMNSEKVLPAPVQWRL